MTDEDRGLAGCAAGYHLGLAQAIRWPCHDSASKVRDAQFAATPGQVSRDQIPRRATGQRAMDEQQPSSHALFVSATPDTLALPAGLPRATTSAGTIPVRWPPIPVPPRRRGVSRRRGGGALPY